VDVQSPDSPSAYAITQGQPQSVTGLQAKDDMLRKVGLTWNVSSDQHVEGYEIFRSDTLSSQFVSVTKIRGKNKTEYVDKGEGSAWGEAGNLGDKTIYFYKINAINVVDVNSPDSLIISATTRGKPPIVAGLEAESMLPRKVKVKWQSSSGDFVDGYVVYQSVNPSGPFAEIAQVKGKEKQEYMDKGNNSSWGEVGKLQDFTNYYYQVRSINIVDVESDESMTISATTKALPEAVTGFSAENRQVKQIPLQWSPSGKADLKEFEIFRGDTAASVDKKIETIKSDVFQYVDKKLEDGKPYHYKIRAVDHYDLPGEFSAIINATTKPLPSKPVNPQHALEALQVRLTWDKNPENDIARYQIERSGFFAWEAIGETADNYFQPDEKLEEGDKVTFRIIAIDTTGLESPPSDEIIVSVSK
jgi:fibronectin type 3 domain-containing protein